MTHLGEMLSALLDGELSGSERRSAGEHLEGCPACRSELNDLEYVRDAVRALPMLDPPSLAPRRRRLAVPIAWASAAAVTVALAIGLVAAPGEKGPVFDMGTLNEQHTARVVGEAGVSTLRGGAP